MGYADLSTLHTPIGGARPPAAYGRQIESNFDFLAGPPACRLYQTTGTDLTHNDDTTVLFGTEAEDTDGLHSTTTNTGRVTAPVAGLYLFTACVQFPSNTTGIRGMSFRKNGVDGFNGIRVPNVSAGGFSDIISLAKLIRLAAGDYVELRAYQNSGGTLTTSTGAGATTLECVWQRL